MKNSKSRMERNFKFKTILRIVLLLLFLCVFFFVDRSTLFGKKCRKNERKKKIEKICMLLVD